MKLENKAWCSSENAPNPFTPCAKDRANDRLGMIGFINPVHVKNEKPILPSLCCLSCVRDRNLSFVALGLLE